MAQRPTRKAGILKTRHSDPSVQKSFDAIIERLEVLDGLRGDELDRAVTFRDMGAAGFTITTGFGGGGGPQIGPDPDDGGDGPGIGPAVAPTNLAAGETFLALLLTWENPSYNLQHIEIWRSAETTLGGTGDPADDNVSLATMIGTSVAPLYMDYVGGEKAYFYWIRSVGTDGTFSSFNDIAGTYGETGIDPSAFEFELNISGSNLDQELSDRINLIDFGDGVLGPLWDRIALAEGELIDGEERIDILEGAVNGLLFTTGENTFAIDGHAGLIETNRAGVYDNALPAIDELGNELGFTNEGVLFNAQRILALEASVGEIDASAGQEWLFDADVDGFTAQNAVITWGGGVIQFTPSAADPQLLSETFNIGGGTNTQVIMRVRKTVDGGTWEGKVYYSTPGHTISSSYVKTIPDPNSALSEWVTLTWDMSDLDAPGGNDWIDSNITQIRFDLVSNDLGKYEIDWVLIAKFSTSAISEAISALDARVEVNVDGIFANATDIVALKSVVDVDGGPTATAQAVSALTTRVDDNQDGWEANAGFIVALQATVFDDNGDSIVDANATAVNDLDADVAFVDGRVTAQAQETTQLVARMSGGYASLVNPLMTQGENFGTTYTAAEIQDYAVGGRVGTAARVRTAGNLSRFVYDADGVRINVDPNSIYEVKFSVYHNRLTNAGSFYAGLYAYNDPLYVLGEAQQSVQAINDRVAGSSSTNPYWLNFTGANHDNEWLDVTCYILGADVDPSLCPNMIINGFSDTTGYGIFNDGYRMTVSAPQYVHLRFLNYNSSPSYGDDTETSTFVTDLSLRRVDSEASNYAALQVQATVTADDIGDLHAIYAVKTEFNTGGVPYISGFGLASDVIAGTATSAFGVRADQFFIQHPNATSETVVPFSVGLVTDPETGDVTSEVGINGTLIVDGTIRATSIIAQSIGTEQLKIEQLYAFFINADTITGQLIRTAPSGFRVEIEGSPGAFPIWYGSGTKSAGSGLFYVDLNGNVVIKGLLNAGMIKQSYFAPLQSGQDSFRIATEYPNHYSGGEYTGKKAHLFPMGTWNHETTTNSGRNGFSITTTASFYTDAIRFIGPLNAALTQYGRLGSFSELFYIQWNATIARAFGNQPILRTRLQYRYDNGAWTDAPDITNNTTTSTFSYAPQPIAFYGKFITRSTAYSTIDLRLSVKLAPGSVATDNVWLFSIAGTTGTANFGYADASIATTLT